MSTPTRYRRLSPAERREQILDAANALFAERGYEDVLVEDIAPRIGRPGSPAPHRVVAPGDEAVPAGSVGARTSLVPSSLGTDQRPGSAENRGASGLRVMRVDQWPSAACTSAARSRAYVVWSDDEVVAVAGDELAVRLMAEDCVPLLVACRSALV